MIRLLHLSDPHFGALNAKAAAALLEKAYELKPTVTILSGDLTMRARRAELRDAKRFFHQLPAPRLVIPGNHDIPGINHPFDRFFRPFRRYRQTFGDELEPELSIPGLQIVSLNSTRAIGFHRDWSLGFLSPLQLSQLPHRFSPGNDLRIVVLHHPLIRLGEKGRETVMPITPFLSALATAKADLVLCGHFHRSTIATTPPDSPWTSVISQAPTACSTRLQGEPAGFHLIDLSPDTLDVSLFHFDGSGFTSDETHHFASTHQGWRKSESLK